jgi:DNA-directed RNA polymerase specialized sigma24 family protein
MTDDELARAVIGADELAAFERAYVMHADEARRLALAFIGDSQLAADAVHSAFLEILRHIIHGGRWRNDDEARASVLRNAR